MSSAARPLVHPAPAPSAPSPIVIDKDALIAELRRDNASLRARTRVQTAALLAIAPRSSEIAPEPVAAYGRGTLVEELVTDARTLEALGDVPAIRFVRNAAGEIVGVELAALRAETEEYDPGFRALALVGAGMAVVA